MSLPTDPLSLLYLVAIVVVVAVAAVSAWRTALALKLAFAERLDALPGGKWHQRAGRKVSFWVRVAVHGALLIALIVIIAGALRLAVRLVA